MRLTTKRNGKNVIPMLMAVCGMNLPYWKIDRADDLHSYLSGDAADKLADFEDAEDQGRLVVLPKTLYEADDTPLIMGVTEWEVTGVRFYDGVVQAYCVKTKSVQTIIWGEEIGKTIFLSRAEAEAALKGETEDV